MAAIHGDDRIGYLGLNHGDVGREKCETAKWLPLVKTKWWWESLALVHTGTEELNLKESFAFQAFRATSRHVINVNLKILEESSAHIRKDKRQSWTRQKCKCDGAQNDWHCSLFWVHCGKRMQRCIPLNTKVPIEWILNSIACFAFVHMMCHLMSFNWLFCQLCWWIVLRVMWTQFTDQSAGVPMKKTIDVQDTMAQICCSVVCRHPTEWWNAQIIRMWNNVFKLAWNFHCVVNEIGNWWGWSKWQGVKRGQKFLGKHVKTVGWSKHSPFVAKCLVDTSWCTILEMSIVNANKNGFLLSCRSKRTGRRRQTNWVFKANELCSLTCCNKSTTVSNRFWTVFCVSTLLSNSICLEHKVTQTNNLLQAPVLFLSWSSGWKLGHRSMHFFFCLWCRTQNMSLSTDTDKNVILANWNSTLIQVSNHQSKSSQNSQHSTRDRCTPVRMLKSWWFNSTECSGRFKNNSSRANWSVTPKWISSMSSIQRTHNQKSNMTQA